MAAPEANLIKVLMEHPEFKAHKVVRVRIKLNFGHWCHPHQNTSWGMCESFRWVAGIEVGLHEDTHARHVIHRVPHARPRSLSNTASYDVAIMRRGNHTLNPKPYS